MRICQAVSNLVKVFNKLLKLELMKLYASKAILILGGLKPESEAWWSSGLVCRSFSAVFGEDLSTTPCMSVEKKLKNKETN